MVWGLAPGEELKEETFAPKPKEGRSFYGGGPVNEMLLYFMYHRRTPFGRKIDDQQRGALAKSFKRLLAMYPDTEVKRAIDRFYLTSTAKNHPKLGFAFCNRDFQERLFADAVVEVQDDVLRYISEGFERTEEMDLPWEESADTDLALLFVVDPEMQVLARTFPDVIAEVLTAWGASEEGMTYLKESKMQFQWLLGVRDEPSKALDAMSEKFKLPKDFTSKQARPRNTQNTISEAVRVSRER